MAKKTETQNKVKAAFHEVYQNVPKSVKATGKTGEEKRAMMTAIALSKARAAGARIPSKEHGGPIEETGVYLLHEGETVVPAPSREDKGAARRAIDRQVGENGNPKKR